MTAICSNCGARFISPYCPECGQKAGVGRLTMHNMAHELWHGFTHTDKGIVRLWTDLLLRPATAYHNYFNGKRKSYFSPVVFFLLSFGFYIYFDEKVFDYQDHLNLLRSGHLFNNEVGRYIQEHAKYLALMLLPFQAVLTWLFFRRRANLAECITFWLFCVGFTNTLQVLLTPLRLWLIDDKNTTDFYIGIFVMLIFVIHLLLAFGKNVLAAAKAVLLTGVLAIISVYITFYFVNLWGAKGYPSLQQSIEVAFMNKAVSIHGTTITVE